MFKTRASLGLLALASVFGACVSQTGSTSDVEERTSALGGFDGGAPGGTTGAGGCPAGLGGAPVLATGIRGFTRNNTHYAVVHELNTSSIIQVSGAPFKNPITVASDALSGSAPWGYVRSDGLAAVLYVDAQRHVHEIAASSNLDLFAAAGINAPAAAPAEASGFVPDVIGYVRSDNKSAIIYRSATNHVIELKSNFGGMGQPAWLVTDLTAASGASVTVGKGSAFPFVRSDSFNSIVYVGSDNRIHAMSMLDAILVDEDMSTISGDTGTPASEPIGVRRPDGYNSILFVDTQSQVHQLASLFGGAWGKSILAYGATSQRPAAYTRPDGTNVVVYASVLREIVELRLANGQWLSTVLPTGCVKPLGPLFGHTSPPSRNSVLFYGASGTTVGRYELFRSGGSPWTLSTF